MKIEPIKSRGFTLIETIIAIAILTMVIITTTDLFVSMIRHQRRILSEQDLLNQTGYVVEYMSRALRMANNDTLGTCTGTPNTNYQIINNINGVGDGIKFINNNYNPGICQEFRLDNGRIKESKAGGAYIFLTSEFAQVNSFKVRLSGDTIGDNLQPRVTIFIDIQHKGTASDEPRKKIQTTISQRNLDE